MELLSAVKLLLIVFATTSINVTAASLPSCQSLAPQQTALNSVKTAYLSVPAPPFGVVYASRQKHRAFVSLSNRRNSTLGVLDTSTFPPSLVRTIALPGQYTYYEGSTGVTLTSDGKHVLVAAGMGAVILSTKRAVAGKANAIVGELNGTTATQNPGNAAIEVTMSPHNEYAFVSQEYGAGNSLLGPTTGNIDVFKLENLASHGNITTIPLGYLNLAYAVVGTALSPDGRTLYAVSETTTNNDTTPGILSVIDVKLLETNTSYAVIQSVSAGCGPVRVIVSSDGGQVWVTARESNHLLAYDSAKLVSDPANALLASVQVGTAPVGLAFVRNETRILTADSNRFNLTGAETGLTVVDVQGALGGSPNAVLGRVSAGLFPREIAVSPDGKTALVADYASDQVQAVDVTSLP